MEQGCAVMEASFPAKRIRLDLPDESLPQNIQNNYPSFGRSSSLIHGNNRNSNNSSLGVDSNCDSGFNEMSPPSLEEDMMGPSVTQGVKRTRSLCDEDEAALPSTTSINQPPVDPSPQETPFATNSQDENEVADDNQSVCSNESKISGMSNFDSFGDDLEGDLNAESPLYWLHQQMLRGQDPKVVLQKVLGRSDVCPKDVDDAVLWRILFNIVSTDSPPPRQRLRHLNTIEDATRLIKTSKKIIVLTGAGVSVSCGIPDFRSKDGIYARLAVDFPNLPDPQAMFDIQFFRKDPRPFFKFAKEIYPGQFIPSLCHKFIKQIESHDKLLRNYTQNIDTLEQEAGISNVIQCHGSFASATCQKCQFKVKAHVIKEQIFAQEIPMCPRCSPYPDPSVEQTLPSQSTNLPENIPIAGTIEKDKDASPKADCDISKMTSNSEPVLKPIMKPDIVFFGEGLPDEFHDNLAKDKDECDLLIVIGSSLKVRPVALIPSALSSGVPQILINREPLSHLTFDIELLGDCDVIINELLHRLGASWHDICTQSESLNQVTELLTKTEGSSSVSHPDTKETTPPSTSSAPHPKNEEDIEALRACWAPKVRESMAAKLPEGSFFYNGQHRYIFKGAEVYYDPDDIEEEEQEEEESSLSDLEAEEKGATEGVLEKSTSLEDIVGVVRSIEEEVINSNSAASSSYRSASCESYQSCDESAMPSSAVTSQHSVGLLGEEEGSEDWMSLKASLDSSTFSDVSKSKEENHTLL